jgi:hypothetical protein
MKTYKQFTEAYKHLLSEESQAGHDLAVLQSIIEDLAMGGVKDTVNGLIRQLETIVGEQIK